MCCFAFGLTESQTFLLHTVPLIYEVQFEFFSLSVASADFPGFIPSLSYTAYITGNDNRINFKFLINY